MLLILVEGDHLTRLPRTFRAEILRHPNCQRINVELLSPDTVFATLAAVFSPATAQRLSGTFHQISGGNPLLLQALIGDARTDPLLEESALGSGATYQRAVLDLLYRGSYPLLEEVAKAAAILGRSASLPLLCQLIGMDRGTTSQAVAALSSAGILENAQFRHRAARSAVLDSMSTEESRKLHSQAAHLLNDSGEAAAVVAPHIVACEETQPWGIATLRKAAEEALAEGESKTAIRYLRRAHEACTDEQQRATLTALLINIEWRSDPAEAAKRLPQLVSAVRGGLLSETSAVQTSRYLLWNGQVIDAVGVLRSIQQSGETVSSRTEDMRAADGVRLWLPYFFPGLSAQAALGSTTPPSTGRPSASVWAPQYQAATVLDGMLRNGSSEELLNKAEQILLGTRLDEKTLLPLTIALNTMVYCDDLDKAESWCGSLFKAAPSDQTPMWHALFAITQANIHLRRGKLAEAERLAQSSLSLASSEGWGVAIGLPVSVLLLTAVAMGKYEKAATYLSTPLPEAIDQTLFGAQYLYARGHYHVATGEFEAAVRDFHAAGDLVTEWQFDNPTILPWRSSAAHAHLCLGELEQARALVRAQAALVLPEQHRAAGVTLRAQAATEPKQSAVPLLERAAGLFDSLGDRLELAQTLVDLSHAHHSLDQQDIAEAVAGRALKLADECGADPLKAILIPMTGDEESTPRFTLHSSDSLGALSRAEKRVAALAAQGHTNRQISNALHITVSTVEQHLTRIYRKLSVKQRADIGSRLQLVSSCAD
ncbi:LuxR C-terminal-related transcriptional regulator [Streptomyces sp. NPDC050147]|uniref:LuxR C-terminal-related transcriptional regulator n=1 Tax=Streptomyces sp. NPDC050147 TaxID=3155513 RepID=UPI00343299A9